MHKYILVTLVSFAILMLTVPVGAAENTVNGTLNITYNSRITADDNGSPKPGATDVYTMNIVVADTMAFRGTIKHLPPIFSSTLSREVQKSTLTYNMNLIVRNPANLSQERTIGKLVGGLPIDRKGVYNYGDGTLRIAIDASGRAAGFESKFVGTAAGKAPKGGATLTERVKKQAQTITRNVKGKTASIVVTDYDIMAFNGLTLASGPVRAYPETITNGQLLYDYERSAWYFRGLSMSYVVDGKTVTDKLSGNIKWVESPQRSANGEGQYEFDIRFNEPEQQAGEAAVFEKTTDEAAFFEVDKSIPSLTGIAKYKDQMRGDTVASSAVTIDLIGNSLTKQQIVNITKLVWLVSVVPFNAE